MEKQVFVERKTLSDGSPVFNVVLVREYANRVGSSRVRLICASQLDAETIEAFLQEQIKNNCLIGIE